MKNLTHRLFIVAVLSILPAQGQTEPVSQVPNPPPSQAAPTGVIGFSVLFNGKVWRVFPGSDLNRYGIHRGDRLFSYMGQKFHGQHQLQDDLVGPVGTPCDITFLHDGHTLTTYPRRVDASLFLKHEPLFNKHYHKVIAKSKKSLE